MSYPLEAMLSFLSVRRPYALVWCFESSLFVVAAGRRQIAVQCADESSLLERPPPDQMLLVLRLPPLPVTILERPLMGV